MAAAYALLAGIGACVVFLVAGLVALYLAAVAEQVGKIRAGALDPDNWTVIPLARWITTRRWS